MTEIQQLINAIIEGMQDKKAHDIVHVDMSGIESAAASHFVITTGNTKIQADAIADNVREHVEKAIGRRPFNYDGYQNSQWIIIDYGNLFAHIFIPEERERFRLEELWADAVINKIPDLD